MAGEDEVPTGEDEVSAEEAGSVIKGKIGVLMVGVELVEF